MQRHSHSLHWPVVAAAAVAGTADAGAARAAVPAGAVGAVVVAVHVHTAVEAALAAMPVKPICCRPRDCTERTLPLSCSSSRRQILRSAAAAGGCERGWPDAVCPERVSGRSGHCCPCALDHSC